MLLQTSDVVHKRILDTMQTAFTSPEIMRWLARKLVESEKSMHSPPLKGYFEGQLERNLRMILAEGVQDRLAEIVAPMVDKAVKDHVFRVSAELKELRNLKSKGPIGRR